LLRTAAFQIPSFIAGFVIAVPRLNHHRAYIEGAFEKAVFYCVLLFLSSFPGKKDERA